ncbi:hypothetical protein FACS1894207_0050 [Bacteroidia bacterium]|nr:hypothetical protein FACS1894207_0050 [Bacteroidia bacterium]
MKRTVFFLSMLATGLLVSSCSNDLDEGQEAAGSGKPISFNVLEHKQLRSATTTSTINDFRLLAVDETGKTLIDGLEVTGTGAHWTYSPLGLWPETETTQVNFYAFSPAEADGIDEGLAGQTGPSPTIKYALPGHSVNTLLSLSDQEDLLVTHHTGTFFKEGVSGVNLNFRHALSRVLFKAKSESSHTFEVLGIALKNIKSSGKLNLASLPKDNATFDLAGSGYRIYWDTSVGTNGDLVANLGKGVTIKGDGDYHYFIVDDTVALYVIPQENTVSSLDKVTLVNGTFIAPSGFYIEITYKESGQSNEEAVTYAVPVPAIVGDAYKSSIAFEIERQYTFQFELFSHGLAPVNPLTENIDKD